MILWRFYYLYLYLHLNGTFYVDTCLYLNNSCWKCFRCNSSASSWNACLLDPLSPSSSSCTKVIQQRRLKLWKRRDLKLQYKHSSTCLPTPGPFRLFWYRYSWEFFDGFESVIGYFYGFVLCQRGRDVTRMFAKVTFHALRTLPPLFMAFLKYF